MVVLVYKCYLRQQSTLLLLEGLMLRHATIPNIIAPQVEVTRGNNTLDISSTSWMRLKVDEYLIDIDLTKALELQIH